MPSAVTRLRVPDAATVALWPRRAALCILVVAGAVLAGYALGSDRPARLLDASPAMPPNTAAGLALAALAMLATALGRPRVAGSLAGLLVALALAVLFEHVTTLELGGFDAALLPAGLGDGATPGRPAPQTTVALLLLAAGVLLPSLRTTRTTVLLAQLGAVTAAATALIALLGQVTSAERFSDGSSQPGVALLTALALLLAASGTLALWPSSGLMRDLLDPASVGPVARRLALVSILVPVALAWLIEGEGFGDGVPPGARLTLAAASQALALWLVLRVASRTLRGAERDRDDADSELLQAIADMQVAVDLAHEVVREPDAREAICDAACRATHGDLAVFLEPDGEPGRLLVTAVHGEPRGVHIGATLSRATVAGTLVTVGAAGVTYLEPVRDEGEEVGVVVVGWADPQHVPEPRERMLLRLLAAQAAVALEHRDILRRRYDLLRVDEATELPTARSLEEWLPREIERARRYGHSLHLVLVDVAWGPGREADRPPADALLRALARGWQRRLDVLDGLLRLDDRRFALLLPDRDAAGVEAVLADLRLELRASWRLHAAIVAWDGSEHALALLHRADRELDPPPAATAART